MVWPEGRPWAKRRQAGRCTTPVSGTRRVHRMTLWLNLTPQEWPLPLPLPTPGFQPLKKNYHGRGRISPVSFVPLASHRGQRCRKQLPKMSWATSMTWYNSQGRAGTKTLCFCQGRGRDPGWLGGYWLASGLPPPGGVRSPLKQTIGRNSQGGSRQQAGSRPVAGWI